MDGWNPLWGELTSEALASAATLNPLVILPCGCTEQHALHLPVDTDTWQVERLSVDGSRMAWEQHRVRALVLPPLPYGPASEHYSMPGTISLPNELWIGLVKAIIWSALDSGFTRIAAMRGCGGHWALPGALWDVKAEAARAGRNVTLRLLDVAEGWHAVTEKIFPGGAGGHAAVMETALCLAGRELLVRRDRMQPPAVPGLTERYRDGGEVFLFSEMTDTGALGDPSPATAEGGERAWETITAAFADRLLLIETQDRALGRLT
jgi:creatinine amidohydrolase